MGNCRLRWYYLNSSKGMPSGLASLFRAREPRGKVGRGGEGAPEGGHRRRGFDSQGSRGSDKYLPFVLKSTGVCGEERLSKTSGQAGRGRGSQQTAVQTPPSSARPVRGSEAKTAPSRSPP